MRKLLSKSEVASFVNLHDTTVMRMVQRGLFPRPIKITPAKNSRVRFLPEDVECWLQSRQNMTPSNLMEVV